MKEMTELEKYYNKFNEEKRLTRRHGQVEFITSMKYIHECIGDRKCVKILDIGAGTGRYSVALADEGHDVTAVELVKYNLGILKSKNSTVKAMQGNAMKLSKLQDDTFDITLLFGPMYHLFGFEDKLKAMNEAKRVTKDFHCLPEKEDLYDYVRVEDIDKIRKAADLDRIKLISADGQADLMRPVLNAMDEETFNLFVEYHLATCERQELVGAGAHTVDILEKRL